MKCQVSIIIPAYRAKHFICSAIDSVLQQTLNDWELIVVDDASPDSADDLIGGFSRRVSAGTVRLVKNKTNLGPGATRNVGILIAEGPYIAFLDHDDVWLPNHLESVLGELNRSRADVAFSTVQMFDSGSGSLLGLWGPTPAEQVDFGGSLFKRCFIAPSAVILSKKAIMQAGLFEHLRYGEDFDLWLRMLEMGLKFAHFPEITCRYRKHPSSASQQAGRMALGLATVRYKHMRAINLPQSDKRRVVASAYFDAARVLWRNRERTKAASALTNALAIYSAIKK